jgi:DNA repair ATPase RecN
VEVTEVRERLSVGKQIVQKSNMERFNLKKLNDVEVKEEYWIEISNRYAVLDNLDDDNVDINRTGKVLQKIQKLQPQRIYVIMTSNNVNHGLIKSVQNYYIKGSRLNCNGCKIQAKQSEIM